MDAIKRRIKRLPGRSKRSSSPASTSSHRNSLSEAPNLLTKVSSNSLRTNSSVNDNAISQISENLSTSPSLSPPLAVLPSVSPSPDQSSTSNPPPTITITPFVPITEVVPATIAAKKSTESLVPILNLWEEVFQNVNEETKIWIQTHNLNSKDQSQPKSQIKELITLLENKPPPEEKDTPFKIVIGKHKITFRDYVTDVVAFLTMAGDIAAIFAPPQASAPWAAVKALLQIPVKEIEQMVALAGTVQWFTRVVRRGQVYELLYNETTTDKQALTNLHHALRDLYIAAMELLARSDVLLKNGTIKQTLNAILRPNEVTGLISELSQKEQNAVLEVQLCEASRSARSSMQSDQKLHDMLKKFDEMSAPLIRVGEDVAKLLEKMDQARLEKLMNFISSEKFGKGHSDIKSRRTKNTGNWLINHECFRNWQTMPSSTILCLKGNVGTGKTFLTFRAIDYVKKTLETSAHDEGFAFFYCNRSGPSMQDPLIILRSFVRQLLYKAYGYDSVQESVRERCEKARIEGRDLDEKDCTELISDSLNLFSKTTIFLDALDESDTETFNLAQILVDLVAKAVKPVKVFVSSRPDREYLRAFEEKSTITIDSNDQQIDIGKFLDENLYFTPSFQTRQKETQELIRETFTSRNGGMFRWVYLQVKRVNLCISNDAVDWWAKTIPRDLMGAYDQMWEIMKNDRECDMPLIERAIKWVLCSLEPFKADTLLEAVRYTVEGDALVVKERQSQEQILLLCQDFLTIDKEKQLWRLSHASVAEYFESRDQILGNCDAFASNTMVNVLMIPDGTAPQYEEENRRDLFGFNSFFDFVANGWYVHLKRYDTWLGSTEGAKLDTQLVSSLKRFLGSPAESSNYYRNWVGRLHTQLHPSNVSWLAMCLYGFENVLQDWWEESDAKKLWLGRSTGWLELAAKAGYVAICGDLLRAMDIKDPPNQLGNALNNAISQGQKDVVSLLVTQGKLDINLYFQDNQIAVVAAASCRHPLMFQWLVDQGWVDVNREYDKSCGNPLIEAANRANDQAIRTLLGAGADVNAAVKLGEFGSALAAAVAGSYSGDSLEGRMEAMQTLLDKGADPNLRLKGGKYGSALETLMVHSGIEPQQRETSPIPPIEQFEEMLSLLLEAGADPAMILEYGDYGSALSAAAFYCLKDMLAVMVEVTGKDRAIDCLGRSRHPEEFFVKDFETWKQAKQDTIAYLTDFMGVDKETLHKVGLWQVSPDEVGTLDGVYFKYRPSQKSSIYPRIVAPQDVMPSDLLYTFY
ncbi:hypothetical protein GGI35DRAFT_491185 [Trichoderma velutinum]